MATTSLRREDTLYFFMRWETWLLTVASETKRRSAISALEYPLHRRTSTACSASVTPGRGVETGHRKRETRREVLVGEMVVPPLYAAMTARITSSGDESLRRKPLAFWSSAARMASSSSKEVRTITATSGISNLTLVRS